MPDLRDPQMTENRVLIGGMALRFRPTHSRRAIEYLRAHMNPEIYLPDETQHISRPEPGGRLWATLGIPNPTMPQIRKLAAGTNPLTKRSLTARNRARDGGRRTSFLAVVFNAPKSVSIMSELGEDHRIRNIFHHLAGESMATMEWTLAGFRVRKLKAANRNRLMPTRSMAYLRRLENDSRYADPHLHEHVEIFNATFDAEDPKAPFKALSMHQFLCARNRLSLEFDRRLAEELEKLGYLIRWDAKGSFEIEGVPPSLIRTFSRGREAFLAALADQPVAPGARCADRYRKAEKAALAPKIRLTQAELKREWKGRLSAADMAALSAVRHSAEVRARLRNGTEADQADVLQPIKPGLPADINLPSLEDGREATNSGPCLG